MSGQRKLIEVALPLEAINIACKADKDRKTGTIRNLHKWFAPMPLPAWRALLFAAMIDDPGDEQERERLLQIIERLVESGSQLPHPDVLHDVRSEIARAWPDGPPAVLDAFCGGASTLVAAQDLGLATIASDLNPIPVLIADVLTARVPAAVDEPRVLGSGHGALLDSGLDGLRADVMDVAQRVRAHAMAAVGPYYEAPGDTPVAYFWTRTAPCPNPACGLMTPLATTWWIQKKAGAFVWIEATPIDRSCTYKVTAGSSGEAPPAPKVGKASFKCLRCGHVLKEKELRAIGTAGEFGLDLMAVGTKSADGRAFRDATPADLEHAHSAPGDEGVADVPIRAGGLGIRVGNYGLSSVEELFTPRQRTALAAFATGLDTTVADLCASSPEHQERLKTVAAVLGLALGKLAQFNSDQVHWKLDSRNGGGKPESAFGQAILPMSWDFVETNPFGGGVGDWLQVVDTAMRGIAPAARPTSGGGSAAVSDARDAARLCPPNSVLVACDPPYFGQIGYADLSDYFYVWIRRALRRQFPDLFATVSAPRTGELVASPDRHDDDEEAATDYFVDGFCQVFTELGAAQHSALPLIIVYASREQERMGDDGPSSWEAMLDAVFRAGLMVAGTWPIRATGSTRMRSQGSNALASYIALVCRPRSADAPKVTAQDFSRLLRSELEPAIITLQKANIAPVDLAQAMIGPGIAAFSRNAVVRKTDGSSMSVREALQAINRTLGAILDEQETDLDADSRWAATWYEQHGYGQGAFGDADQLARAKGISVQGLDHAGIVESGTSKVRLLRRDELLEEWTPAEDARPTAWEAVQYMVRALGSGGELAAADVYGQLGVLRESARELAYRLFQIAERKGMNDEAQSYNGLVASWPEIARLSSGARKASDEEESLF